MAERRMMSKKVIHSDPFMDLPATTKNLYFYLMIEADDDGFVNSPKRIQRMIGATDDDASILIAKKFILSFESGVIVVKHWRMHNYIRSDRYNETSHKKEKAQLNLKENGVYTMDTIGIPSGSIGKDRIGKESIDKYDIGVFSEEEFKQIKAYRSKLNKSIKTQLAVTKLSNSFKKCYDKGFSFDKVFTIMQENQWQSINVEWIKDEAVPQNKVRRLG